MTEQGYEKYEPQSVQRVTVIGGKTTTVTFNNVLKRGELTVTKTSEDSLVEGMKFHLYGTSLSGIAVDEYAVTDSSGKAYFKNVLIGSGYVLEEVDTPVRYVVPDSQTASVEWNTVMEKSVANVLKKWNATVTKSDRETGTPQGNASLAGAVYDGASNEYRMTMKGTLSHTAVLGADVFGNLTRMDNVIDGLPGKLEAVCTELADTQVQLENARTELAAPFAREAELAEKTARLKELNILLNMDQKDNALIDDAPDEDAPERPRSRGMER